MIIYTKNLYKKLNRKYILVNVDNVNVKKQYTLLLWQYSLTLMAVCPPQLVSILKFKVCSVKIPRSKLRHIHIIQRSAKGNIGTTKSIVGSIFE